ncbi:MAG: hypothetical protein ACE5QW_06420 [Thermoplasmata archaeon]
MRCEACGMFMRKGLIIVTSNGATLYFCCEGCRDTYQCQRDKPLQRLWKKVRK